MKSSFGKVLISTHQVHKIIKSSSKSFVDPCKHSNTNVSWQAYTLQLEKNLHYFKNTSVSEYEWATRNYSDCCTFEHNISNTFPSLVTRAYFFVKCGGDSLVWNHYNHRVDAEVTFYMHWFPLICRGVLRATLITFVLPDDLHINVHKFVAGRGAVVQPNSINIVFGYKQAQQYSRIHQFCFIRAVSWSAQNAESHWSHVHITLKVEHFNFHAFQKKRGSLRDLISYSSRLTLLRR